MSRRRIQREMRQAFIPFDVPIVSRKCPAGGKLQFEEIDAKLAVANVQAKDSPWRQKLEQRAYECDACGWWHLTSEPLRSRKV